MFLLAVVSVAALFIGGAASAALQPGDTKTQDNKTITSLSNVYAKIDGLAPKTTAKYSPIQHQPVLDRGYFYAYNAYDPSGAHDMGPITFDTPDAITLLATGVFPNFCGGADMDEEGNWYGCDYAGGLYSIDMDTGAQTFIGSTIGVNGMTYDFTTGIWYVTSANTLYTMDVTSGATTSIGSHGVSNTFIGLACDIDGNMYGYDVLWTGDSTLYSVDKSTGVATAIGSMGYGFVYAQDMGYDRDNDVLYIAGYFNDGTPSALLTCDVDSGACTIVGSFEGGMEVDGFAVPFVGFVYDHDIGITSIVKPATGNAGPITPVVKVKNAGLYTETNVPVQLLIGKELISGIVEDFEATDGGYTHAPKLPQPDAWAWGAPTSGPGAAHSGFNVWATNLAGNYPPSMWCYLLTAPFTVPSGAMFNFWHWYYFENNYDGGNLKISTDGGVTWTLITPVGSYPGSMPYNPFMTGQAAYNGQSGGWKQANFDLSAYEGQLAQIMFETASDSSVQYTGWYIDDVGFTITSWVNEYTQTATIASIAPEEVVELSFPTWAPSDLGLVENVNVNYNAEATALLVGDENINNDYKEKAFNLHYGFFHDVAVTEIISPVDGLAVTQTPEVVIENHGQNAETVEVEMTIGKAVYTTLLEEDFAGGVPPAGWGTNYPGNWYSSSTNYAGGVAPEAIFSWTPSSVGEHLLYTGNIDTTGFTALALKFKEYVNDYNGDYTLKVVTSIDGGATWQDAYVRAGGPYGPTTTEITLTAANGIGSATFMIAWDMSGDSFNINYWYIDDVWMGIVDMIDEYAESAFVDVDAGASANVILPDWTPSDIPFANAIDYLVNVEATLYGVSESEFYTYGFEDWVPYTPPVFPPSGWAVYNVNTGNAWVSSTSGYRTGTGCAKCTYDYAVQPNDDWLATGPIVVAPGEYFSLWVDTYSYGDDEYEIYMSTTGNTPADFLAGTLLQGVYYPVPTVYTQYTFDMSAYAGQTVWFAIRYTGWYAWYIWVDDVHLPDGSFQGFEGSGNNFPGWVNYQYGSSSTYNMFVGVTSGTSPTCSPHSGTYMAKYGSYSVPSGASCLFVKNTPFDFTGASGYSLKFWMMHDTGYAGYTDEIYVCASPDGYNYYFIGDPILRYDATATTPTWAQHS
ncbi:MAG: immune inhibitor A, partial [Candidatus Thermoplasmatota archaeon]|nr:immune inhibitor A [Candidatus Thermoplasmatota archaeon]